MFERFTGDARRVIVVAQDEARRLHHEMVGTEHLLLGLIGADNGVAADALQSVGITLERARAQVGAGIGPVELSRSGSPPFTPGAKKALELSLREALQFPPNAFIGTEVRYHRRREGADVLVAAARGPGDALDTSRWGCRSRAEIRHGWPHISTQSEAPDSGLDAGRRVGAARRSSTRAAKRTERLSWTPLTRAGGGWPRVRRVDCWQPYVSYGSRSIAIGRTPWRDRQRPRTPLRPARPGRPPLP